MSTQAESSAKKPSPAKERVEAEYDEILNSTTKLEDNLTFSLLKTLDREDEDDSDYIPGPTPPTSEFDSEDSLDDDEDDWETSEGSVEEEEEVLAAVDEASTTNPIGRTDDGASDASSEEGDDTSKISSDSENVGFIVCGSFTVLNLPIPC
ncbi:hypothetical protein BDZ89DRAFT_1058435 [Hymenopellis radicata]|nr:hypothetical protein BDZ89DRAFT_1058435 [Hymenopellis radicata]